MLYPEQKRALAAILLSQAGDIIEFWDEIIAVHPNAKNILQGVNPEDAAKQFAIWLKNLPGTAWDSRIPLP